MDATIPNIYKINFFTVIFFYKYVNKIYGGR